MPLYANVCGMLSLGLAESGSLERAEEMGMSALHMDPQARPPCCRTACLECCEHTMPLSAPSSLRLSSSPGWLGPAELRPRLQPDGPCARRQALAPRDAGDVNAGWGRILSTTLALRPFPPPLPEHLNRITGVGRRAWSTTCSGSGRCCTQRRGTSEGAWRGTTRSWSR
jgi:hypothetical protein